MVVHWCIGGAKWQPCRETGPTEKSLEYFDVFSKVHHSIDLFQ